MLREHTDVDVPQPKLYPHPLMIVIVSNDGGLGGASV